MLNIKKHISYFILTVLLLMGGTMNAQYDIPPVPKIQTSVYDDEVKLLTAQQKNALEQKLVRYADSTSTQIVVAIISTTKGEDISFLGAKWGQKWGIGQADEDNGILILLAKDDRKVDINTGYGIEYRLSDRMAERIINSVMVPQFKAGNFYGGLDQAADAIFASLNGEFTEDRDFSKTNEGLPPQVFFFLVFLFIVLVIALSSKKNGRGGKGGNGTRTGSSLLDIIILSSMGRTGGFGGSGGSFGGGSSSGGGFGGGFGGGGFGGGGASGGW